MLTLKQIVLVLVLVLALLTTAAAQESTSAAAQRSSLTITATAAGERLRITAPASVVQMHIEVYGINGEKVFDQEIRGGNVFDWHLQNGQAQRLAPGSYVCVVTAKSVSGKLTQKIGTVTVAENSARVLPADSSQLSVQQTQAIGPVEENSAWTIPANEEPQTTTVIAHDGADGQMIRGRGALTFRVGNFFNGIDKEQMRLTEEGNLGLGTSEPKAKLDVAGTIRAERFLVAKPKTSGMGKTDSLAAADSSADSVQPLVAGTGTAGRLTKWTDGSGTLGDSLVTESDSNIGIGTTSPQQQFHVMGTAPTQFRISKTAGTLGLDLGYDDAGATNASIYNRYTGLPTAAIKFGFGAPGSGEVMTLLQSGSVGLGTTSPQSQFHIMGPSVAQLRISKTAASLGMDLGYDDAGATNAYIYNRYTGLPSAAIKFGFGATPGSGVAMTLLQNGNVGIGTTGPTSRLAVQTASGNYGVTHTDGVITVGSYVGSSSSGAVGGWLGTQSNHRLHFFTNNGQPAMTIGTNGSVGIGTSTPPAAVKLDVVGSARFSPGGSGGAVELGPAGGETGMSITGGNRADVRFDGSTLKLLTGVGTGTMADTNGININIIGNVGIGTTSPGAKLEVITTSGNGVSSASSSAAGYGVYARNTAGGQAMFAEGNAAQSRDKGGFVKAMVFVNENGTIARCYNSTLSGGGTSSGNCGFNVSVNGDTFTVDFGFRVDDRFVLMSQVVGFGSKTADSHIIALEGNRVFAYSTFRDNCDQTFCLGGQKPITIVVF